MSLNQLSKHFFAEEVTFENGKFHISTFREVLEKADQWIEVNFHVA